MNHTANPTTADVMPAVTLLLPGDTPALKADAMQRTIYAMRDRLMQADIAMDERTATEVAAAAVDALRTVSEGEVVHALAALRHAARMRRDEAIRREIRTGNAGELAQRYGITPKQVYRIAKRRAGAVVTLNLGACVPSTL